MDEPTPPPLPPKPILCVHFEGGATGFKTGWLDRERLEKARQQALRWMADHPYVEVISVDSCLSDLLAIVTVWYRE